MDGENAGYWRGVRWVAGEGGGYDEYGWTEEKGLGVTNEEHRQTTGNNNDDDDGENKRK